MTTAHSSAVLPLEQRLRQVLLSISRQAERDLALLSSHHPQARIHALRVRMKKLRAVLLLIAPAVAPSTLAAIRRSLRILKQAFAMNRDQHVLNALLVELCDDTAAEWNAPKNESGELPAPAQLLRLQATARSLTRRLQSMTLRHMDWDDVARAYARRYAKARRWFRRCEHRPSAARLHHWRSPVKDHYFQSLLVLPDPQHLKAARKLASRLGRMHDLAMLREHYDHGASDRLVRSIDRHMKHLRVRIFRKARKLFDLAPRKLAVASWWPEKRSN